ncbi:hypothetical protein PICMEDRAFT_34561 [Pichia membranifaciens NRRL Y-2026]|uniref:SURF1-like protein n=1 Tax=Pichia membranifaciens NRRL Y-2026 TaxID=763406 RepID=A0A1E3NJM6_9ASCO|nr:hypothetical protein PICMEDRAFT_34561 [Pichia membranifaciens NRRL Y-2026]ODQ45768.1 hypothetical protein PICMEDRAFT_34561 [Pichia membranifaciens NRRL Y-2026]
MFSVVRSVRSNKKVTAQLQRSYASAKTANIDWNPVRSKKQLSQGIEFGGKTSSKVFLGLLCLAPIITFALGTWQVKRLKWKNKLVAECEDRLTYKPIPMPRNVTKEDLPNLEYRKVLVTGHFDYSREVYVGPRLHDTRRGYTVVCPFVQSNGAGEVLIDRGWIAAEKVIPSQRNLQHLSVPKGEITIECVIRVPPKKGIFSIDHDKGSRLYQYLDADAMAEELGSRPSLDYDTAEEFDPLQFINAGVPLGKIPKVDYKNNHLNYLVTWYSLSFASTVLLIYMFKKGKFMNPTEEKLKYTKKIMS